MIDVIMAFLASVGVTGMLLGHAQGAGLSGMDGLVSALSGLVPGGLFGGIACLMITQALAVLLVWKSIVLYYIHWVFRKCYDTSEKASQAIEETVFLPLSPLTRKKLRRGILTQFMRGVWARREQRLKQEGLM